MAVKPSVTLLTGSDMSVIKSGLKRKNYSDSSYSYSGIGPKEYAQESDKLDIFNPLRKEFPLSGKFPTNISGNPGSLPFW